MGAAILRVGWHDDEGWMGSGDMRIVLRSGPI